MSTQNNNATPPAEKLKALQLAMDKIEKDHGKGTIMKLGDNKKDISIRVSPQAQTRTMAGNR